MRFQRKLQLVVLASISLVFVSHDSANAEDQSSRTTESFALHETETYRRIKTHLDSVRAIDTHDHLEFDSLPSLYTLLRQSYFAPYLPALPNRQEEVPVRTWWPLAQRAIADSRTMGVYRYQLPAFRDLYGVDFDSMNLEQAEALDEAIRAKNRDPNWVRHVVTERANIDMLVIDYDYTPYDYVCPDDYGVAVVRLNPLIRGFHPDEYTQPAESPYHYAETRRLPLKTFDDYLAVLDHIMQRAAERGAVGMKSTLAYRRTLHYEAVTKSQAAEAFGKRRGELTPSQIKAFEDYVFRQFCELSEKHVLPLQIHTGYVLSQSNPLLLENLIRDYPKTTFILFHGGYPWVGETAAMALHFPKNVWIDSNWLPTLSYHMAKRAYHEWLDVIPANRIMWGSDTLHAEGLYGATETTRQCLAEVLAERVAWRQVSEAGARHIGEQILRESALLAFPRLRQHVARRSQQRNQQKDQQPTEQPPAPSAGR